MSSSDEGDKGGGPPEGGTPEGGPPEGGTPDELRRLSERLARLEAASGGPGGGVGTSGTAGAAPGAHHRALRNAAAVVLIVIASVLAMPAVLAVWAHDQVANTDRYVATVAPLAGNPAVQDAAANRIAGTVVAKADVPALVGQLSKAASEQGVPPRAADLIHRLGGPIEKGLTSLVREAAHRVVAGKQFATIWVAVNRAAHNAFEKALSGRGGGPLAIHGDQVTVDLAPAVEKVKQRLVDAGLDVAGRIPQVHTDFVVFDSPDLAKYKTWFRLLGLAGDWLPLITVVIAAIGVLLSTGRRRALIGAALGVVAAMLVLGVALAVFRTFYLDHLPTGVSSGAAAAVYDALVRFLREAVRAVGVLAAAVAIGAFLIGPSRVAVTLRTACRSGIVAVRGVAESAGFRAGPAERFTRRFRRPIGVAILLVAALVFAFWAHPTAMVVFWFVVVVLGAFGIREFLAPGPERGAGAGGGAAPGHGP
ncbi:hypothetical protein ACIHFE_14620 [Streptomyces sp. NPDC052396]|uniref:hypothetical protein n=1 Tax=Streptomyces sp. NPDC052396 TaxID=3365689 RepID=UPI0037D230D9